MLSAACVGEIAGSGEGGDQRGGGQVWEGGAARSGGGSGGAPAAAGGAGTANAAGPTTPVLSARVWRLTHEEYQTAVGQVLGLGPRASAWKTPPGDPRSKGYSSNAGLLQVSEPLARHYLDQSEAIVATLDDAAVAKLLPCQIAETSCAERALPALITRFFRRPPRPADVARYRRIFDTAAEAGRGLVQYRAVLRALLVSPHFLYRTEIGAEADGGRQQFRLTDFEIASFLAFALTGSGPTVALLDRAGRHELGSPEALARTVDELLAAPEASSRLRRFASEWLAVPALDTVEKNATVFPTFEMARGALRKEAEQFLAKAVSLDGNFRDLFLAPVTMPPELQAFYAGATKTPPDRPRTGLLGLGAFQAVFGGEHRSSPTRRGHWIRERALCQELELPPGDADAQIEVLRTEQKPRTTRALFELHDAMPGCASCHRLMDPLGYTLESFDGVGRFRTHDNGVPIDTRGELVASDVDRGLAHHVDLAQALAGSADVARCLTKEAFRFFLGSGGDGEGGVQWADNLAALLEGPAAALARTGRLRALLRGLLSNPALYLRHRG